MNVIPVIVNNKLFCMLRNGSFADLLNAEIITRGVQHKAYDLINAPSPYRKCKIAHIKVCAILHFPIILSLFRARARWK